MKVVLMVWTFLAALFAVLLKSAIAVLLIAIAALFTICMTADE